MHRKEILTNAITHTCGERDVEYGSPKENFEDIAALWNVYLSRKYKGKVPIITAEDVAWMMGQLKMARTFNGNTKPDTYEDAACYPAIAGECAAPYLAKEREWTNYCTICESEYGSNIQHQCKGRVK